VRYLSSISFAHKWIIILICYFNEKHSVSLSRRIARDRMEFRMEAVERRKKGKERRSFRRLKSVNWPIITIARI